MKEYKWIELPSDKMQLFKELIKNAPDEQNYSSGCPFDLTIRFEVSGEIIDAKLSTDSCGVFVLGDNTYQWKEEEYIDKLIAIFVQYPWNG